MKSIDQIFIIESLLDMEDEEIKSLWMTWDKGDCSLAGIIEILLYQTIRNHKIENKAYYDTTYDNIKLRIGIPAEHIKSLKERVK